MEATTENGLDSASGSIRIGQSAATDPETAVAELHAALVGDTPPAVVVFFTSPQHERGALARAINSRFGKLPVIGCTTAGEIGPLGYLSGTLSGFSLPQEDFTVVSDCIRNLRHFEMGQGQAFAQALTRRLDGLTDNAAFEKRFAFALIDGLSVREEPVARAFQSALGGVRLFGGSAGDELRFGDTWVFHDGVFHRDAALLTLVQTSRPFRLFKTQHFVCDSERLVVTEADPARRVVTEINGLPAAEEYARLVGTDLDHLTPSHFAQSPVVVVIDGTDYVRSIQKVNPDGSLTFFSAIDEGLVLRVARGMDMVDNLRAALEALAEDVGPPELIIVCDCILRHLEIESAGLREQVAALLRASHAVGFSTYGEQYQGVHVNQTLTGVALGARRA